MLTQLPGNEILTRRRQVTRQRFQQGTIRQDGPSYFGYFTETRCDEQGREVRRRRCVRLGAVSDITEKQARRILQTDYLNAANSANHRKQDISITAFIEKWKATVLPGMKPSTQSSMRSVIRQHIEPSFGAYSVSELDTETVQAFASRANSLSPKTLRNIIITLRSIWRSAVIWKYAEKDQVEWAEVMSSLPRYHRPPQRVFTADEVPRIIAAAPQPYRTFYRLLAETGLRAGEICGLTWGDVDLERCRLRVRESVWQGRCGSPKSAASIRLVFLSAQLAEALQSHRGQGGSDSVRFVFETRKGTPWNADDLLKRKFYPLLDALKIPRGGLHAFRRFCATESSRLVGIKVVQETMGHVSEETTLNHYIYTSEADHRMRAEAVGKVISPGPTGVQ
jgi:integrase